MSDFLRDKIYDAVDLTGKVLEHSDQIGILQKKASGMWYDVVQDLGVKGDGSDNAGDTAKIQNALNTLPAYSVLYFPKGTYIVTSTLLWDGTISLVGAGRHLSTIKAGATLIELVKKKDEWKVCGSIHDLTLDGNCTVDYVLDFLRGKGLRAYHNYFKNAKKSVVRIGGSTTWGAYEVHLYDNDIIGVDQYTMPSATIAPEYGIELAANSSDSQIYDNICVNATLGGILQNGVHNYVENNHIWGSKLEYLPEYGIKITKNDNFTFLNRCDTPKMAGIFCNKWGNKIHDNHVFWNTSVTPDLSTRQGIFINNTAGDVSTLSIKGNYTEGAAEVDIKISGNFPDRTILKDNTTTATTRYSNSLTNWVAVNTGSTSISVTFKNPFANYNFIVIPVVDWNTQVSVVTSLTGVTFNFGTAPTYNTTLKYTIIPFH